MRDIKRTLKVAGIIALCINIVNVSNLLMAIFLHEFSVLSVVSEAVCIAITFVTGIIYLCLSKKSNSYIIKRRGLFLTICLLNILNNILVWIIALWVEIAVSNAARFGFLNHNFNNEDGSIEIDKNDYNTINKETDYLSECLKDLEAMKNKGEITEEEYAELRKKLISRFLEKNGK